MIYKDSLAPWERQNEYYNNIRLGSKVDKQTQEIKHQAENLINSQLRSANSIIASQDRIRQGIENTALSIDQVKEGINSLKSSFEWGISDVVWQIEQNRKVLKEIVEILVEPSGTHAKERRTWAIDLYEKRLIEEAEDEFLESLTIYKYDFTIHISLGMIYLFHHIDKQKAFDYFKKAFRYAELKSSFYASYALLYQGLILRDYEKIELSEKCTEEAILLSPDFSEAYYQSAQYNAQLGNIKKSLYHLEKAIKDDRFYCLKADKDNMFDPIRHYINELIQNLTNNSICRTNELISTLKNQNQFIHETIKHQSTKQLAYNLHNLNNDYQNIEDLIHKKSYFDALDAENKTYALFTKLEQNVENIIFQINRSIDNYNEQFRHYSKDIEERTGFEADFGGGGLGCLFSVGIFLIIGKYFGKFVHPILAAFLSLIIGPTVGILLTMFFNRTFSPKITKEPPKDELKALQNIKEKLIQFKPNIKGTMEKIIIPTVPK